MRFIAFYLHRVEYPRGETIPNTSITLDRGVGKLLYHNGEPVVQGIGAAALGHPARAVAWLANKLISFGVSLEPGDIVLSGSLGPAIPIRAGDVFTLEMHGQPPLSMRFVEGKIGNATP